MKLHRLEVEGFGPFRTRQVVDFDAFDADGIFLITGRTGAGKSSLLDAVCFALYGSVPRYEGAEKRLRSDHCTPDEPTLVALEFTVGDARWRVTRAPEYERPKARGAGLTTVPHIARLEEQVGGAWIGRAAKPREVAALLDEILGLSRQQFLQVILLAQNRFAEFLLAKNDERQALLRTLFGSRTFGEYQEAFEQRRRAAGERLAAGRAGIDHVLAEAERLVEAHALGGDADATPAATIEGRIEVVERALQRGAYRVDTLDRERDDAEAAHLAAGTAHTALTLVREKQQQRDAARLRLAELDARTAGIADDRTRAAAAAAAELLRDPIERALALAAASRDAEAAHADAQAAWVAVGESAIDPVEVAAAAERMTGDLALWKAAAETEQELAHLERRHAEATLEAAAQADLLAVIEQRLAQVPERQAAIERDLDDAGRAAALLETARQALDALRERLAAAREALQLDAVRQAAEAAHADAALRAADAVAAVTVLLQRRVSGMAGELAAALDDGEPCAVCGSREHPHPAPPTDDPVTDADLDAADAVKTRAVDAERVAADAARAARAAVAAASSRAGGEPAEALEGQVTAAADALEVAERAATRKAELDAEKTALVRARADDEAARDLVGQALAAAMQSEAVLAEQRRTARAAVDDARGAFETVAARVADTRCRRDLARALAAAAGSLAHARDDAAQAQAVCDRRVAESEFETVARAIAALPAPGEREALDARVRAHELALSATTERLRDLELELAGTPDEPVDLEGSQLALAAAKQRWIDALEAAGGAQRAVGALRDLLGRATRAAAGAAELADAHMLVAGLADAVSGRNGRRMDLETFVLAAELEEIVAAANLRLDEMSAGRYLLQHTDASQGRGAAGLGLEVVDAYTGRARPPQSLSGGETFLASLALALGLAQVVTDRAGGLRLDTLFVDEGFGSLDGDTLELAMRTLDELRQGGRTVGVISHVDAMKEQLPAQLVVRTLDDGSSAVVQDATAALSA